MDHYVPKVAENRRAGVGGFLAGGVPRISHLANLQLNELVEELYICFTERGGFPRVFAPSATECVRLVFCFGWQEARTFFLKLGLLKEPFSTRDASTQTYQDNFASSDIGDAEWGQPAI